jgi:hypothetical protein
LPPRPSQPKPLRTETARPIAKPLNNWNAFWPRKQKPEINNREVGQTDQIGNRVLKIRCRINVILVKGNCLTDVWVAKRKYEHCDAGVGIAGKKNCKQIGE